jgi:bifunctional N-acetylglucosamine-1-phosphate-uridyltransferase/glucosamine-1-phosphate-acetyltransferase GlmU-like protein
MKRLLIVPAAGRGSRLGVAGPKALVPVDGRPMLDHLLAMHEASVDRVVLVVAPGAREEFAAFARARELSLDLAVQAEPTGMLDAIWTAQPFVARYRPVRVVVTWCDQIGVTARTIRRLDERAQAADAPPLLLPTLEVTRPYIHFDRDASGRIVGVRQRRDGDAMPERGETDMGLFDLSLDAYLHDLERFARGTKPSPTTGERNFLPFIPWLASRHIVETIPGMSPIEVLGINTPEDLATIESYLADAERS